LNPYQGVSSLKILHQVVSFWKNILHLYEYLVRHTHTQIQA